MTLTLNITPPIQAALDRHCAGIPAPTAEIAKVVVACCEGGPYNGPDWSGHGSLQLWPKVYVPAYAAKWGLLTPLALEKMEQQLWQDELWRGLSHLKYGDNPPEPAYVVVKTPEGKWLEDPLQPIMSSVLAKDGSKQPVGVDGPDAQHLDIASQTWTAALTGSLLASQQGSALLDWMVAWCDKALPNTGDSERALGHMVLNAARAQEMQSALGIVDTRPLFILRACVKWLKTKTGFENGVPHLMLHEGGLTQSDHGYCRQHWWMSARIPQGLAAWLDISYSPGWIAIFPQSLRVDIAQLYKHGLKFVRYGYETAEDHGALLGGCIDDAEPSKPQPKTGEAAPRYFVIPDTKAMQPTWFGVMQRWAWLACLPAKTYAPAQWAYLRLRIEAAYHHNNAMKPADTNAKDHHSLSIALSMQGEFGVAP